MNFNEDFFWGFLFAERVFESMLPCAFPNWELSAKMREQLAGIVGGELTLMQSWEDYMKYLENKGGKPVPENVKTLLKDHYKKQSENNSSDKRAAEWILHVLTVGNSTPPT